MSWYVTSLKVVQILFSNSVHTWYSFQQLYMLSFALNPECDNFVIWKHRLAVRYNCSYPSIWIPWYNHNAEHDAEFTASVIRCCSTAAAADFQQKRSWISFWTGTLFKISNWTLKVDSQTKMSVTIFFTPGIGNSSTYAN